VVAAKLLPNLTQEPASRGTPGARKPLARGSRLSVKDVGQAGNTMGWRPSEGPRRAAPEQPFKLRPRMKEETACSVLRIMGIATTLVGAILTIQSIIAFAGLGSAMSGAPSGVQIQATGALGSMGGYLIVAQAVTIALGVAFIFLSPRLARLVVE